jgi:N-acetylmuramoyl-L-alanine amidase
MKVNSNNKGFLGIVIAVVLSAITFVSLPEKKESPFVHIDQKKKSNKHFVIIAGHGSIDNGKYQTAGKQSPTWNDGLKIYEGYSCKLLALDLVYKLNYSGLDATLLNNYSSDLSLLNRVQKVSELFSQDNRLIVISLHHNAQITTTGDYKDFEGLKGYTSTSTGGATGTEVYTSPGTTESDNFVDNYLLPQLKNYLPDIVFRNGGKAREANFYILSKNAVPRRFNRVSIYDYLHRLFNYCK